jgi:pyruvate formate lyase activating enzyme
MNNELTGKVYDIQGFSLQDGPGIRTTVFLKGCPLRCAWCHSPESQHFYTQLSWMSVRCIGAEKCGKCLKACSRGAISPGKRTQHAATKENIQLIRIDRSICNDCGECVALCTPKALSLCGADYTPDELLQRLLKDRPFYEHSGGGVTVSGGEPLSQPEFLFQLLKRLREGGIHTALDTSGYAPYEAIECILPYTNLFLYDLKHMDPARHQVATGVSNERILENAERIVKAGGLMQIRVPVIPDFNDTEESIQEIGMFCRSLGSAIAIIQLLPYHNLGVMKYQRLDDSRIVPEAAPPSDGEIQTLKKRLEALGLPVTVH